MSVSFAIFKKRKKSMLKFSFFWHLLNKIINTAAVVFTFVTEHILKFNKLVNNCQYGIYFLFLLLRFSKTYKKITAIFCHCTGFW